MNLKFRRKKIIYSILLFLFTIVLFFCFSIYINRNQVYPTTHEKHELNVFFQNKDIQSSKDIIYVQNKLIDEIKHEFVSSKQLSIDRTLNLKKGFCYDRSLVLQKYFLMKGFKIRPVFLYWQGTNTKVLDFFKKNVNSHNIFELFFDGNWYVIRTNTKMEKLENIKEYLNSGVSIPKHTRYIRYLNNRNGNFLYPSYLPDIYFF
ncbi:MAG: hypothetical protein RL259_184 [Bacteroidota bacterium]|jgi:hypothetical protein